MKLTNNFSKSEFESKDGLPMPDSVLANIKELATNLQVLRNYLGQPITINSGYRSPNHNKRIGGAKNSQHVKGNAADIVVKGHTPKDVYLAIEKLINAGEMKQGGLGLYLTFVHYDIRGTKSRW